MDAAADQEEHVMSGPPPSLGWSRMVLHRLKQDEEIESEQTDAVRHQLDDDEAETLATRNAEERRRRREHAGDDREQEQGD
jgi:hypothetical protein